jgi:hypothetical protein
VCAVGDGIPLARLWLQRREEEGGRCYLLAIDPTPPFRRPLRPACWPARLGQLNLGQVLGHRWEEACVRLADLGVPVGDTVTFTVPDSVAGLRDALDCSPFVACKDTVHPQVADLGPLGRRVVGFCGQAEPAGEQQPEPTEQRPRTQRARRRAAQ